MFKLSRRISNVGNLRTLGIIGLGMEASDVEIFIQNDKNDISSATFNLLAEWARNQPNKITAFKTMQNALQRVGMIAFIEEIQ